MNLTVLNKFGLDAEQGLAIGRLARLELARRYAARKDILNWGRILFPEKFSLPFCQPFHSYLIDTRKDPFTCTEAPRNHAKTTIKCFLIPIFQALEEPSSFLHYLNVQSTLTKALSINTSIRQELETNEDLIELYGSQIGEKWNEQQFVLKNGVIFTGVGTGQSIRGINHRNIRPDYIIPDDLYDEDDIYNNDSTLKKNDWVWSSLFPARAKTKKCCFHIGGTAINNEDILERLKAQPRWKCKTFRAILDWDSKEVLWPELNTFEDLMADLEDMTTTIFMREMQNERRDEATSIVKANWLTDWEYDPDKIVFDDHFQLKEVVLGCDPSVGENPGNDFTGIAVILKAQYADSRNYVYFIENLWNEHLSQDGRILLLQKIADGRALAGRPKINRAYIEGIAGFKDFAIEARRRTSLPIRIVDNVKNKLANLENKSFHFENKRVFLNKNIDQKLKDQLRYQLVTNLPKHDDLRDALLLPIDSKTQGPTISVI